MPLFSVVFMGSQNVEAPQDEAPADADEDSRDFGEQLREPARRVSEIGDGLLGQPPGDREQVPVGIVDAALLLRPGAPREDALDVAELLLAAEPPSRGLRELDELDHGLAGRALLVVLEV